MRRLAPVLVAVLSAVLVVGCGGGSGAGGSSDGGAVGSTIAGADAPLAGATAAPKRLGGTGPLADAKLYTGLTQTHVDGPVRYRQTPPVGGDHAPVWQNCGGYTEAINAPNGVHAMEHGAVWITYRPSLADEEVEVLDALIASNPYLVVSPWYGDDLPSPIVLSAWGVQLGVEKADDPAVAAFVKRFEQGPQTPEPGATCSGGVGSPSTISRAPVGN